MCRYFCSEGGEFLFPSFGGVGVVFGGAGVVLKYCLIGVAQYNHVPNLAKTYKNIPKRDKIGNIGRGKKTVKKMKKPLKRLYFKGFSAPRTTGLEPATTGSTVQYSNQLSYVPKYF